MLKFNYKLMKARFLSYYLLLLLVSVSSVVLAGCEETPSVQQVAVVKVDNVTSSSAECEININLNGSSKITERGVIFDTKDWKGETAVKDADGGEGTFSIKLEGLLAGAVYGVRGYAKNSDGVVYSTIVSFKTPISKGTMTDDEGNEYQTIFVGKQEWMTENLRSTKFNDGNNITLATSPTAWKNNKSGAYCIYTGLDKDEYGYLYNGFAATRAKTTGGTDYLLPPVEGGWRVPTIADWKALQEHLVLHGYGTAENEEYIGKTLAGTSYWTESTEQGTVGFDMGSNNLTGFNALPGGYRSGTGTNGFADKNKATYFWSGSIIPNVIGTVDALVYFATLSYDDGKLVLDSPKFNAKNSGSVRESGFSIRLVRDAQ